MQAWALCAVLLIAAHHGVSAQTTNNTKATSGVSSLTPAQWPIPAHMKLIQHERYLITGRNIFARRLQLEAVLKAALLLGVPPSIGAARTTNYTTIPAITPGYEDLNAIVYELDVYLVDSLDPQAVALPPSITFVTMQLLQSTLRTKFSPEANILLPERYYTSTPAERAAQEVVTAANLSRLGLNTLSRIQLTGEGLLPFNADKQSAFALAVFYAFANDTTLYTLNVTDFDVPQTTVRHRKLLQAAQPSVIVNVWTQSLAANFTPSAYWSSVFSSRALDSVGPLNLTLAGKFINATSQLRTFNETTVGVLFDPPLQQGAQSSSVTTAGVPSSSTGSSGLSAGAIAGIAVGCAAAVALLTAVVLVLLFVRRQRLRERQMDAEEAAAAATLESRSSGSSDDLKMDKAMAADLSFESAVLLWDAPKDAIVVKGLDLSNKGCAPELDAADIELCIGADGKRVRLGGGPFSTVYRGRHHQRDVAVKELRIEDGLASAVQREVQLAERVNRDANVVQFYGVAPAPHGHSVLLVMEYMAGGDLRAALDGPNGAQFLWHNRGARIAADIALGLAHIHSTGVVHRDLKSSNVLLSGDGAGAKVADIGSAALLDASQQGAELTSTLAWAAPELLAADRNGVVDAKADSYSFGVVLWELCTGEMPARGAMRPLQTRDCPPAVAALVAKCMAQKAADRPTAVEVSEQLRALVA